MTSKDDHRYVILLGNICDGFRIFGPFDSFEEADEWEQNSKIDAPGWIATIEQP